MQEQWQESDHKHQQNQVDASFDPVEERHKLVASILIRDELTLLIELANIEFVVERAQEHDCESIEISILTRE
jgi:hypothetical protein